MTLFETPKIVGLLFFCASAFYFDTAAAQPPADIPIEIPHCTKKLGTITVVDGDDPRPWQQMNLAPPQKLIKTIIQKSGCFSLVDRGAGLNAASRERELKGNLGLQSGSNIGRGQIKTADFVVVAEIASADYGHGGTAGLLGGVIGGRAGAISGGFRKQQLEAAVVLSLIDVRTSESNAFAGVSPDKNRVLGAETVDLRGSVGGGYEDTAAGKATTQAFLIAYTEMVDQLGGFDSESKQSTIGESATTSRVTTLRTTPSPSGKIIKALPEGSVVYPTGKNTGLYGEIADENDNVGWIRSDSLDSGKSVTGPSTRMGFSAPRLTKEATTPAPEAGGGNRAIVTSEEKQEESFAMPARKRAVMPPKPVDKGTYPLKYNWPKKIKFGSAEIITVAVESAGSATSAFRDSGLNKRFAKHSGAIISDNIKRADNLRASAQLVEGKGDLKLLSNECQSVTDQANPVWDWRIEPTTADPMRILIQIAVVSNCGDNSAFIPIDKKDLVIDVNKDVSEGVNETVGSAWKIVKWVFLAAVSLLGGTGIALYGALTDSQKHRVFKRLSVYLTKFRATLKRRLPGRK